MKRFGRKYILRRHPKADNHRHRSYNKRYGSTEPPAAVAVVSCVAKCRPACVQWVAMLETL